MIFKKINIKVVLTLQLIIFICSCSRTQPSITKRLDNYRVDEIKLVDSIIYRNYLDKTLGIPSRKRIRYEYLIHLSGKEKDTKITIYTTNKIEPHDVVGKLLKINKI